MDKAENEIYSAIIKILKENNISPLDGIECIINVTSDLIYNIGEVKFGFKTGEEKEGFVKNVFQQALDQL